MLRLRGCLGRLPRAERRVLVLRAGLGHGRTRSRRQVARITGLSSARVARLERRGLRHLLAVRGTCAGTSGTASVASAAASASGTTTGGPGAAPAASSDRGKVLAEHLSGGDGLAGAGEGSTSAPSIARPTGPGDNAFIDLGYPLVAVALAVFTYALVREARRPT